MKDDPRDHNPSSPEEERGRLLTDVLPFLSNGKFVNVATCNEQMMPNVAPKLVAKVEENVIYLVDYVKGRTYENLKNNARVSISFMDEETLTGYQLKGAVHIIEEGEVFERLSEEFIQIKTKLTVERILLDLHKGEKNVPHELALPAKFTILKMKVFEVVEISSSGGLRAKRAL